MKRFLSAASVLILMIMSMLPVTAFADDFVTGANGNSAQGFDGDISSCGVYDNKGILDIDQLVELNELIQEASEDLNLYIMIYLSDTARSEWDTKDFSDCLYEDYFGPDTDGVFYYMDLSEQSSAYDYISTSGIGNLYYGSKTDDMLEVIFKYLPASGEPIYANDIAKGIRVIVDQFRDKAENVSEYDYYYDKYHDTYTYMKDGELVISKSKPKAVYLLAFLAVGLPVAIITYLIVYFAVKSHYKFKPSFNPSRYISQERTKFTEKSDRFIRVYTTKTKIESSSGGGGGGSHSSGSHGGGGGHR